MSTQGDYSILEVSRLSADLMGTAAREKFTGKITVTMHLRDGGVGSIGVMREHTVRRLPQVEGAQNPLVKNTLDRGGVHIEEGL